MLLLTFLCFVINPPAFIHSILIVAEIKNTTCFRRVLITDTRTRRSTYTCTGQSRFYSVFLPVSTLGNSSVYEGCCEKFLFIISELIAISFIHKHQHIKQTGIAILFFALWWLVMLDVRFTSMLHVSLPTILSLVDHACQMNSTNRAFKIKNS